MADQDTEDDKQFEASQHKLDEARRKGELPRSIDLNTAAAYAGLLLVGATLGGAMMIEMGDVLSAFIARADTLSTQVFEGSGGPMTGAALQNIGVTAVVFFAVPAVAVIGSLLVQRGFVFAPSKLEPKLSRISPIEQAKNKFGRNGFFEFGKSFAKLLIYSTVLFLFLLARLPEIMATIMLTPEQVIIVLLRLTMSLLLIVFVIAIALGLVDYLWQRAEHLRKNRMSRKEMTDEMKNSEGDPHMKQQRRQRGVEIAQNQMMADVPEADVVIVNPTHYAVALKWDRSKRGAPVCVAKGVDQIALQIREIANEHSVPIQSDPPTARALYATVEIGEQIKSDHYKAVAAAIRFADRVRKARFK